MLFRSLLQKSFGSLVFLNRRLSIYVDLTALLRRRGQKKQVKVSLCRCLDVFDTKFYRERLPSTNAERLLGQNERGSSYVDHLFLRGHRFERSDLARKFRPIRRLG